MAASGGNERAMGAGRRRGRLYAGLAALSLALGVLAAQGPDAVRGKRLFADTGKETGADVAACASCHASVSALRAMLSNRGVRVDDAETLARWLQAVLDGAQPGATNAKAQFRGVLTPQDVRDLAAYIVGAKAVAAGDRARRVASSR